MNIDGTNTLACLKPIADVKGEVRINPLPHMAVVKDLVPDLSQVYAQLRSIEPWLQVRHAGAARCRAAAEQAGARQAGRHVGVHPVLLLHDQPARAIGGTATAIWARPCCWQAYRWIADSRDEKTGERLDALQDPFKLYRCHTIMNCTQTCPKGLNPAQAIGKIKQLMVERQG